jgi:hypothetical protein
MEPRRYRVRIGGREFVVRGLTRREYLDAMRRFKDDEPALELFVCETATLWPPAIDFNQEIAGIVTLLAQQIWDVSGLLPDGKLKGFIYEANAWLEDSQGKQEAIALACIPGLTLERLQSTDPADYLKYLWLGQFVCELFMRVPVQAILDPEGFQNAQKQGKQKKPRVNPMSDVATPQYQAADADAMKRRAEARPERAPPPRSQPPPAEAVDDLLEQAKLMGFERHFQPAPNEPIRPPAPPPKKRQTDELDDFSRLNPDFFKP